MQFVCKPSTLVGSVSIPGSKSHTIRAVAIASLAAGESRIHDPLVSDDALSAARAFEALGSTIRQQAGCWTVEGCGGKPTARQATIDVGNSGTTLRILMGTATLMPTDGTVTLTGDGQIRRRPAQPLIEALNSLGASVQSRLANGCAPIQVTGHLQGGLATVEAKTSQYVTSLLMACPLAATDTTIRVPVLYEKPYVLMTLNWLKRQGIRFSHADDLTEFHVPGNQRYSPFDCRIPADFSSATFFLGAGALGANDVTCGELDMTDPQADKAVVGYLEAMGAGIDQDGHTIRVHARPLRGVCIDLNDTPDALPVMAVLGCFAEGETRLHNVAQARIKETDRIAVMTAELTKMGADVEEFPDGMIIRKSRLHGCRVNGHHDHRVVMALALAGFHASGTTTVDTAEAASVTFPNFDDLMRSLGGKIAPRTDRDPTHRP